jgi:hypothetical protein
MLLGAAGIFNVSQAGQHHLGLLAAGALNQQHQRA